MRSPRRILTIIIDARGRFRRSVMIRGGQGIRVFASFYYRLFVNKYNCGVCNVMRFDPVTSVTVLRVEVFSFVSVPNVEHIIVNRQENRKMVVAIVIISRGRQMTPVVHFMRRATSTIFVIRLLRFRLFTICLLNRTMSSSMFVIRRGFRRVTAYSNWYLKFILGVVKLVARIIPGINCGAIARANFVGNRAVRGPVVIVTRARRANVNKLSWFIV